MKLPRQNKQQSFMLYEFEVHLLEQVYIHRYMRASDLIKLIFLLRKKYGVKEISRSGVSKRLERLVEGGILQRKQNQSMKYGGLLFNSYFYTLRERGLQTLAQLEIIREIDISRFKAILNKISLPSNHTMAASTLANAIYMYLLEIEHRYLESGKVAIMRGNQHPIMGTTADVPGEIKGLIVPDYIVETPYTLIAIEVDSGRQGKEVIRNKVKRYQKFCEISHYAREKDVYVIFSPIDDSVAPYMGVGERYRRTAYLKTVFDSYQHWPDNMHIYCTPSVHVPTLVQRCIDETEYYQDGLQLFYVKQWIDETASVLAKVGIEVSFFDEAELTPTYHKWNPKLKSDFSVAFKPFNKRKRHYIVLRLSAGSVRSYERFRVYLARCEKINESDYINFDVGIFLLYDGQHIMESDILEMKKDSNVEVLLTHSEIWEQQMQSNTRTMKDMKFPLWEIGKNFQVCPTSSHLLL